MSRTATVRACLEPALQDRAGGVFHRLGLNSAEAIAIFFCQVELVGGLPFDVAIPTAATRRAFESTDAGGDLVFRQGADGMFARLGI